MNMLRAAAVAIAGCVLATGLARADEVKVGILVTTSGPYASWGHEYTQAVDLYMEQHKAMAGSHHITVLYRDVGGNQPPRARQLAQELIVRDNVAVLGGLEFTPTVLAVQDLIDEANIPFVIFNSGTSVVTKKSPLYVRPSFTQWQVAYPLAQWAAQHGQKECVTAAADYAPGQDAIDAYKKGFEAGGGKLTGEVRIPLDTTDFSTYLQRAKDMKPGCVFTFMPLGPMSVGWVKAFHDRGLDKDGIQLFATTETQEVDLPAEGDAALGVITAIHYGPFLDNPTNKAFVAAYKAKYNNELPGLAAVAAYDGMEIIFHMVEATNGKRDGKAAVESIKGYKWQSPRGEISIDGRTREAINNIYIRKVVKENGVMFNKEFDVIKNVKEPWHELNP
ncbi:MAG TPA: ABC transporter substrate-binding protein [Alphaproteobacteria bacterium]|nr:ABC transporter substrate-binding protein [Alphaproteobacteria bacterium]